MRTKITISFTVDAADADARQAAIEGALFVLPRATRIALESPGQNPILGSAFGDSQDMPMATYTGSVEAAELAEVAA